ncbi:MAG: hypothetical protein IPQ07_42795 [Myxococcales bacterium]|nr:hypothetical protein [Myxococcales bacterium]
MLLPVDADLFALGLTGVALFGTIAYLVRGGRLFWVVVGGGVMAAVFAVLAVLTISFSCQVIRVTGDGSPHAARSMLVLSTTIEVNGKDTELSSSGMRTIVVNETGRTLRIRAAIYSESSNGPAPPPDVVIEPFGVAHLADHIGHVGPDDPLPSEVSSHASSTIERWLTW